MNIVISFPRTDRLYGELPEWRTLIPPDIRGNSLQTRYTSTLPFQNDRSEKKYIKAALVTTQHKKKTKENG